MFSKLPMHSLCRLPPLPFFSEPIAVIVQLNFVFCQWQNQRTLCTHWITALMTGFFYIAKLWWGLLFSFATIKLICISLVGIESFFIHSCVGFFRFQIFPVLWMSCFNLLLCGQFRGPLPGLEFQVSLLCPLLFSGASWRRWYNCCWSESCGNGLMGYSSCISVWFGNLCLIKKFLAI